MEIQAIESGQVPVSRSGWESATTEEVQAVAPKSAKAQLLAKQLHQLGGAFLLHHIPISDAWALTVFAHRASQNPENPAKLLLCKLLTIELGQRIKPGKRELLLQILPDTLHAELTANSKLFPKPKATCNRSTLVHAQKRTRGWDFLRSLFGV